MGRHRKPESEVTNTARHSTQTGEQTRSHGLHVQRALHVVAPLPHDDALDQTERTTITLAGYIGSAPWERVFHDPAPTMAPTSIDAFSARSTAQRVTRRQRGAHRSQDRSRAGRVLVASVVTGGIFAGSAAIAGAHPPGSHPTDDVMPQPDAVGARAVEGGSQVLTMPDPADLTALTTPLRLAQRRDEERNARDAAARRPVSVFPVAGVLTSSYGPRWGSTHYGLDIANSIGTPIVSVTDGEVIESGPAAGFGLWVRIRQDDGTIGIYGHIDQALVSAGERVKAGDQIATVGNRGQSTGPHLHYEVWERDGSKADPMAWLSARGVPTAALASGIGS